MNSIEPSSSLSSYGYGFDDFNASKFLNEKEWKLYESESDATKKARRETILLSEKRKKIVKEWKPK